MTPVTPRAEPRRNLRGEQTRALLLDAALTAFASRGFHGTSTREIAEAAGMSAAAAYAHFPTKESMLYRLSSQGHHEALSTLEDAIVAGAGPVEQLRAAVAAFAGWHARRHTMARVVQYEMAALTPEHAAEIAAIRRRTQAIVVGLLETGMAAGVLRPDDAAAAGLAVLSMGIDIARWYRDDGRWTPEEIGARYGRWAVAMLGGEIGSVGDDPR